MGLLQPTPDPRKPAEEPASPLEEGNDDATEDGLTQPRGSGTIIDDEPLEEPPLKDPR